MEWTAWIRVRVALEKVLPKPGIGRTEMPMVSVLVSMLIASVTVKEHV